MGHLRALREAAGDKLAASSPEAMALAFGQVRAFDRDVQGRMEHVNEYVRDNRLRPGVIGSESPMAHSELTGLYRSNPEHEAMFRQHLREARGHYAAGRHEEASAALGKAQEIARQHAYSFTVNALEKQRQAIEAERQAAAIKAQAAVPLKQRRGMLGMFGRKPGLVAAGQPASSLETVLALASPASWPSGKPYKESLLPPGPTTGLKQGQQTRTGVIVNAPGTRPALYGQLRQAPAQTVSPSPPLPPGAKLPDPKDLDALAAQVPDGADITLANSIRKHLGAAAGKRRAGDDIGALSALRSAQTGLHAAYRAAYAENLPVSIKAYGVNSLVPPAAQSSAQPAAITEMLKGREVTEAYRKLHHQVATHIDSIRRGYFHGQYNHMPEARFTGRETGEEMLALSFLDRLFRRQEPEPVHEPHAEVKSYERRDKLGREVNVSGYQRMGKPFSGKLYGDEADEAIRNGAARGEYGEPTGYFHTSDGKKLWGWYGAAGTLIRHTDPQTGEKRYLLQKRAPWVQDGGTYSIPGGAIDHVGGVAETPIQAANREAEEELGRKLPEGTTHAETRTKTFGEGKNAWSYHTVVMDSPTMFNPEGQGVAGVHDTRNESRGYVWAAPREMADLPLHPHFRATAEELGMPSGGGTEPPASLSAPPGTLARVLEASRASHQ